MASKDTVYIDIDEDITSVINKVQGSAEKVVALVLPKRATVFQSTINMKLLKKAAATARKSLVLITSDTSVLPLAGAARLHVAKSLQSKPVIPAAPHEAKGSDVISSDELNEAASKAVPAEGSAAAASVAEEVIELDNTEKKPKAKGDDVVIEAKKDRKLKVPNFSSFRLKVFLAGLALVLLVVGWVFGFIIMPKAKILIKTNASTSAVSMQFTANQAAKEVDLENAILPATLVESKKTDTEKVPATGKEDQGTKATGSITLFDCSDDPITIPAGTTFSNSGFSFVTNEEVVVPPSDFTSGGNCKKNHSADVTVTAVKAGGDSILSAGRSYVTSLSNAITGTGTAMGGGTSKMVTVVSQEDINGAQAKLTGRQKTAAVNELEALLNVDGGMALDQTLDEGAPAFTSNVAVGKEASEVTVTAVTSYKMLGIKNDDLKKLVEANIKKSITDDKQKILDNGLESKTLMLTAKKSPAEQTLNVSTSATVGPDIDKTAIARDAAGKKRGDIIAMLGNREDIKDVTVTYSPFWVLQTPKKASKITVVIGQADAK